MNNEFKVKCSECGVNYTVGLVYPQEEAPMYTVCTVCEMKREGVF